ncbi:MAG: uncharacterized protein JWM80_3133 [Cyanobacteria bacterium RYN_339]|nr:uncharacterized protein [Cyanobacteria bacterium RYN_339]
MSSDQTLPTAVQSHLDSLSANDGLPTPAQTKLGCLIGEWVGTTASRFMPTDSFETADMKASIRWVANGTFAYYAYEGAVFNGHAVAGAAFFGIDAESGEGSSAWVDSFHSSGAPMLSKGQAAPGEVLNVASTYGDPADAWTWQTVITADGPDAITIQSYNHYPASRGSERYIAIETKLQRASQVGR